MRQTRQAVHAINQSFFLRCLWYSTMQHHAAPCSTIVFASNIEFYTLSMMQQIIKILGFILCLGFYKKKS
jgi:hypothetical protein